MMSQEVTKLLNALDQGDPDAASRLLPLVYEELCGLAAQRIAQEQPGQTLQPTALVHEAYVRLVGQEDPRWENRGHFFAAAAEAMRSWTVRRPTGCSPRRSAITGVLAHVQQCLNPTQTSSVELTVSWNPVAVSGPFLYPGVGAAGRRRVRGKDCVHLNDRVLSCFHELFSARVSGHRAQRLT
jgi:hypothetical protein